MKLILTLTLALIFAASPRPAAAIGGPSNMVIAMNRVDDNLTIRSNVQLSRDAGPIAAPQNFALASAACTDCKTIAVALQLNFGSTSARYVSPQNVAVASNAGCTRCVTVALAYQVFLQVDDPTSLPEGARQTLQRFDAALRDVSTDPDITLAEAADRIDAIVADFWTYATSLDAQRSVSAP
jgi:hypothetical protein